MASHRKLISSSHILICRTDNIGDVVLTLPMAQRLHELNPGARISLLCRSYVADVAKLSSCIDEVVVLEDIEQDPVAFFKNSDIDTVIFAQPNRMLVHAAFRAGIRNRIGNARQKLYLMLFCNRWVRFSKRLTDHHEAQINFEFLKPFGDDAIPTLEEVSHYQHFDLPTPDQGMSSLLCGEHFNLIFHPRSNGHGREWPVEHFEQLARLLATDHRIRIWLTGSAAEGEWLHANAASLLAQPNVTDMCGRFSLQQLAVFINESDALIASGTGPLHLSGALGKHTIGVFPPTRPMHPGRWAALGEHSVNLCSSHACAECATNTSRTCNCMKEISPEQTAQIVLQWSQEKANESAARTQPAAQNAALLH